MYIAVMQNLFARLSVKLTESSKLNIIQKNLAPFYQSQLAFQEITLIETLKRLGKQLESRRQAVESYVPPPSKSKSMEADLAYLEAESFESTSTASCALLSEVKCYNCDQKGHYRSNCTAPFRKDGFKCGHLNVTTRTCPNKCSGNAQLSPK